SSALYQIGPQVEELYGSQKFVFIYMATGIFSAFASFVFNIGGAGASGAIFGLIGLMAVYGYRQGGSFGQTIMKQMLTWAVIGFLFGVFIGANNVAHASGFAAGAAVGFALKPGAPETNRGVSAWNALAIICVLVLASSFAMAGRNYGNLQRGGNAVVLDRRIEEAREALKDSVFAPESKKDTKQISERLKSVATDLDRVPQIDDRSTEIKQQVAELLRKRAGVLDSAEQNKMVSLRPTSSDLEEAGQAFDNYEDWINSVMDKYGLVSVPKK
ncbi:MAG TPA: rhomboid family intramembrane serine protease, partial [Blastocatellia bacterium]|nr:rhomboid family intramembrane serine protease [Blastocatellia bacterium]